MMQYPVLRYVSVAETLRHEILSGKYEPGQRLPRQHDMAKANGVSFITLKAALDLLEEEGYVVRKKGEGTYAALPDQSAPVALVVDDDPVFRQFFLEALKTNNWTGVAAESGAKAILLLQQQSFALVFLDLVIPGMNGAETFRNIRKIAPDLEVVIVTGYPDSDIMSEALQVGPFGVMRKPFPLEQLTRVLSRAQAVITGGRYGSKTFRPMRESRIPA